MSLVSVREFLARYAPDIDVLETAQSSATVALAAEAHGVDPDQIAKTICVRAGETVLLVVTAGTRRLDNRKFRDCFSAKSRMLEAQDVVTITSHPIGGVCPFGLPAPLPVYCDISLKDHAEVLPAAGAVNAALRVTPDRLVALTGAEWVDICQPRLASQGEA